MILPTNTLMTTTIIGSKDLNPTIQEFGQCRGWFVQAAAYRVMEPLGVIKSKTIKMDYFHPASSSEIEVRMVGANGALALSPAHMRGSGRTADLIETANVMKKTLYLMGVAKFDGIEITFDFVLVDGKDIAKVRSYLPKREVEKIFREAAENSLMLAA